MALQGISSASSTTQSASQLVPETRPGHRAGDPGEHPGLDGLVVEEPAAGPGQDHAGLGASSLNRRDGDLGVAHHDGHGPRSHVLLLADDREHAVLAVLLERLRGVLQVGAGRDAGQGAIVGGR